MVAFLCLLFSVCSLAIGFYGGYRLVRWINLTSDNRAYERFQDLLREHSEKQVYLAELNDQVDSLLTQKMGLEAANIGTIQNRMARGYAPHSPSTMRASGREGGLNQDYPDEYKDENDFPHTVTSSETLFHMQRVGAGAESEREQ